MEQRIEQWGSDSYPELQVPLSQMGTSVHCAPVWKCEEAGSISDGQSGRDSEGSVWLWADLLDTSKLDTSLVRCGGTVLTCDQHLSECGGVRLLWAAH